MVQSVARIQCELSHVYRLTVSHRQIWFSLISFNSFPIASFPIPWGICLPIRTLFMSNQSNSWLCGSARVASDAGVVRTLLIWLRRSTLEGPHEVGDNVVNVLRTD